jgi:hypothetical protein
MRGVRLARLNLSAPSLAMLFAGHGALAEVPAGHSPIPQVLPLKFLAHSEQIVCGTRAAEQPDRTFESSIIEGKRE